MTSRDIRLAMARSKAPGKMRNDDQINVPVPRQLKAAILALAQAADMPVANYVRRILNRHVEEKKGIAA